jgi:hypothetical protein
MKKLVFMYVILGLSGNVPGAERAQAQTGGSSEVKLRLTVGDRVAIASVYDNPTSRDFVSLLPLTLTLRDYASTEKISDLPRKLSTQDAPPGSDPSIGDLSYYAPWGNVALFYKEFRYSPGLIRIAKLDSGMRALEFSSSAQVKIELITPDLP